MTRKLMICSSLNRFFTSNLLVRGDWTPNRPATQNRGDVGFREATPGLRQGVSQLNCYSFCDRLRAARIRCFQPNSLASLAPNELSFG